MTRPPVLKGKFGTSCREGSKGRVTRGPSPSATHRPFSPSLTSQWEAPLTATQMILALLPPREFPQKTRRQKQQQHRHKR